MVVDRGIFESCSRSVYLTSSHGARIRSIRGGVALEIAAKSWCAAMPGVFSDEGLLGLTPQMP
jgi:hypothetical protein